MAFDPADYLKRTAIADGDAVRELWARGWERARPPEPASIEQPEMLQAVAASFLKAGAEILVTPTALANALAAKGLTGWQDRGEEVIRNINRCAAQCYSVAVADAAAQNGCVLGGIGQFSELLVLEEVNEGEIFSAYAAQAAALAEGGVHGFLCGGFSELEALCVVVRTIRETSGLPVIGSMIFESGPEQSQLTLGVTPPQACAALVHAGAVAVGCDFGECPDVAVDVVSLMRAACSLPIFVRVCAGQPQITEGLLDYPESPAEFAARFDGLVKAGANIIGGCGGVTARHVATLVGVRKSNSKSGR